MTAFLGVERSLSGRRWQGPDAAQDRAAMALTQATGLPELVCRLLAARDVTAGEVAAYLTPRLRDLTPDPSSLKDMDKAVARLLTALRGKERIAVFADYDVDGGASAALLLTWLRALGHRATLYIPDRIDEGYGPNVPAMEELATAHDLIICVDCGTLSHDPIAAARAKGADVIVLDHHQGGETLPPALAVVNPNRQDEDSPLGHLCAAGVVFLMLVGANRALRAAGAKGPDLMAMLDLVALATVADVAPLQGLNRAFVRQGLAVMAARSRPGLTALADVASMTSAPSSYHLGYLLGPRVNAGGRIGAADLGARLLATEDAQEAADLAQRLDHLNAERRAIEALVLEEAKAQAEARGLDGPLVWAAGDGWHPGVVGIVAARLKEWANRPAVVIGLDQGEGKGSARSVAGVDLGASIAQITREGLLLKGGGHAMAAGLTVDAAQLPAAMERLGVLLAKQGAGATGPQTLRIDGALQPSGCTLDLIQQLEQVGPFGAGSPAPRFALPDVRITFAKRAGEKHLRLSFADDQGGRIDAIAFNICDTPMGHALEQHNGARFNIAGKIEIDDWGGRLKPKLKLDDAAPAQAQP
ncbi:single-stranded-DNA-specific exonuclease [Rubricella aquisinus]|uniref:Single-stranded-DNA-specific exonuclease RecJ n=1 Tax=Rubricella aquisinus TaxID=2028108 RepID=A0A840WQR3_9RHOB|nr:single-stranded-DNA-specific exonuclease RecJ [Rubricella aquisinus]MBB5516383.1 single-stranded-DNA-specific exonuclease [Rubricella aquisinus]